MRRRGPGHDASLAAAGGRSATIRDSEFDHAGGGDPGADIAFRSFSGRKIAFRSFSGRRCRGTVVGVAGGGADLYF
ncbi:hypothetical protein GCM10022252_73570 [Streptosporangium oxazolinicum]|uniref:Uncharacterized protein n=1 Tax=Streptosporangium oxazolinicum TaxID=909287 RepID=A0ABP8BJG6_9ACTN